MGRRVPDRLLRYGPRAYLLRHLPGRYRRHPLYPVGDRGAGLPREPRQGRAGPGVERVRLAGIPPLRAEGLPPGGASVGRETDRQDPKRGVRIPHRHVQFLQEFRPPVHQVPEQAPEGRDRRAGLHRGSRRRSRPPVLSQVRDAVPRPQPQDLPPLYGEGQALPPLLGLPSEVQNLPLHHDRLPGAADRHGHPGPLLLQRLLLRRGAGYRG